MARSTHQLVLTAALLLVASLLLPACESVEKAKERPKASRADRSIELDVPPILRGTIASETVPYGDDAVLVHGYGLVVGLDGTGSRDMPPLLRQHMLQVIQSKGFGSAATGFDRIKPEALLDSLDTAVVIVEGIIRPGSIGREAIRDKAFPGTRFDVRVQADPATSTTSLEGGRLYTTDLRPMLAGEPRPPLGPQQARALAVASGQIFINPFLSSGGPERGAPTNSDLTSGTILGGGEVTEDVTLKLRLTAPNHVRAMLLQDAINGRFPRESGQRSDTAHGESDELIALNVPPSWRDRPSEFVELVQHITIRQAGAERVADSIRRVVLDNPLYAGSATLRWWALGPRSLPSVQRLYDEAENAARISAIRAGAKLDDPLVIPHVILLSNSESSATRRDAVDLLTEMRREPRIDGALRKLLEDEDLEVRLAAYEGLARRGDPMIRRFAIRRPSGRMKFVLDVVESEKPLIYVTQVGMPRIAIFGEQLLIEPPLLVSAWDGRFMAQASEGDEEVEVYYRDSRSGERLIELAPRRMDEFVQFLAHSTTVEEPEAGLGLSYAETVGALYQMWRQNALAVDFRAEQDRFQAAILQLRDELQPTLRPEFEDEPAADGGSAGSATDLGELVAPPDVTGM